jgi:hypothetical protein
MIGKSSACGWADVSLNTAYPVPGEARCTSMDICEMVAKPPSHGSQLSNECDMQRLMENYHCIYKEDEYAV